MEKLENDLPPGITYHTPRHTRSVIQVARLLAEKEKIDHYNLKILSTAALFHDSGFLKSHRDHEEISCEIAKEYLPGFDYNDSEISQICQLIMVTKLPQRPTNELERIICDADLHYLGTDEYFSIAENLYREFHHLGIVKNRTEWRKKQIHFFKTHQFFTKAAKEEYADKKEENLRFLMKKHKPLQHGFRSTIADILLIVIGVLIAGFALKGFLVPNKFFDGGITGISLLVHELYHIDIGIAILVCNLPLIVASYFSVGPRFALKTFLCIILLAICLLWVHYPVVTSDKLLISIFGGVFLGLGFGFTMRAGCALDGIEILALYTWRRTSFTITEIIMAINILIFSVAAFKVSVNTALYSILTYFAASKTVDFVVEGIEAYTGVTIISGNSELIKHRLVNELGRGITIYKGERGFLPGKFEISADCDIIFTVITRLELRRLKNLVYDIDPRAFIYANTIREASGGIIKRRHIH